MKPSSVWYVLRDREGYYLLTKRSKKCNNSGFYNFPGGKIDFGESPTESAIRELKEEAGISLPMPPKSVCVLRDDERSMYFLESTVDQRPLVIPNEEVDGYVWLTVDNFKAYPLHKPTFYFYRKILSKVTNLKEGL